MKIETYRNSKNELQWMRITDGNISAEYRGEDLLYIETKQKIEQEIREQEQMKNMSYTQSFKIMQHEK